jgi:hypothetical protein
MSPSRGEIKKTSLCFTLLLWNQNSFWCCCFAFYVFSFQLSTNLLVDVQGWMFKLTGTVSFKFVCHSKTHSGLITLAVNGFTYTSVMVPHHSRTLVACAASPLRSPPRPSAVLIGSRVVIGLRSWQLLPLPPKAAPCADVLSTGCLGVLVRSHLVRVGTVWKSTANRSAASRTWQERSAGPGASTLAGPNIRLCSVSLRLPFPPGFAVGFVDPMAFACSGW